MIGDFQPTEMAFAPLGVHEAFLCAALAPLPLLRDFFSLLVSSSAVGMDQVRGRVSGSVVPDVVEYRVDTFGRGSKESSDLGSLGARRSEIFF